MTRSAFALHLENKKGPFRRSPRRIAAAVAFTVAAFAGFPALGEESEGTADRPAQGARERAVYPGAEWERITPEAAGLDPARLRDFASWTGGRGVVVRGGRLAFTWGDVSKPGDVASAVKPLYTHFLFKAIELGKLRSLEERVADRVPGLAGLNPELGWKDRGIRWRDLAYQISGYGVREVPGEAFDYSDYNMALFADALFLEVYGTTWERVDEEVLRPLLADPLRCEDAPTFLAFGLEDRPGRLAISPRDFARFGLLYLRGGMWNGVRLIEERHVRLATRSPLPGGFPRTRAEPAAMLPGQRSIGGGNNQTDHFGSYSFAWWTNGTDRAGRCHWPSAPPDTYGAFGHGGMRALVIVPSLDLIVSWNDTRIEGREAENEALRRLLAAVTKGGGSSQETAGGEAVYPGAEWERAPPEALGLDASLLEEARRYALTGGGSGMITRAGRLALSWGDLRKTYDLKSTTKSIGFTAMGLALLDGKARLEDPAVRHHPSFGIPPAENAGTGWLPKITLFHLATHTAGFEKPGGYTRLIFEPGTKWAYSDGGPNWLAECLTLAYRRDLAGLLRERVFEPVGIRPGELRWRKNAYRPHEIEGLARREFGSGIRASVDAMARIGYLYLRDGMWKGRRILPEGFARRVGKTPQAVRGLPVVKPELYFDASDHYGLLWWNNEDGTLPGVPRDAFWAWGLYDSLIVVIPSLEIVAVRAGRSWKGGEGADYRRIAPFLRPLARAAQARRP